MRLICAFAASLLLHPAPAVALVEGAALTGEKLICKNKSKTGTRFKTKACRTAREWEKVSEADKRMAAEMINAPKPGNGGRQ